jgi:hypothetical protein
VERQGNFPTAATPEVASAVVERDREGGGLNNTTVRRHHPALLEKGLGGDEQVARLRRRADS